MPGVQIIGILKKRKEKNIDKSRKNIYLCFA